jgi:hypothetical protein
MTNVIQKSMMLSTLVYLIVGACGYIAFGPRWVGSSCYLHGDNVHRALRTWQQAPVAVHMGCSDPAVSFVEIKEKEQKGVLFCCFVSVAFTPRGWMAFCQVCRCCRAVDC